MKQKVVIKVTLNGEKKSRSKVMHTAVGVPGVESIAFEGGDKNQIVVIGETVDSVNLTCLLRKKLGYAELLSVSPVEEKTQQETISEFGVQVQPMVWPAYQYGVPQYHYTVVGDNSHESCRIM